MAYIQGNNEKIKNIFSEDLPHSLIKFCGGTYDESGINYGLKTLKEKPCGYHHLMSLMILLIVL